MGFKVKCTKNETFTNSHITHVCEIVREKKHIKPRLHEIACNGPSINSFFLSVQEKSIDFRVKVVSPHLFRENSEALEKNWGERMR